MIVFLRIMVVASSTSIASDQTELHQLRELSARLGADPWRTQGAGGNTSVKIGDTLWIKASGMWLKNALREEIFTAVSLPEVLKAFANKNNCEDLSWACKEGVNGLRPSIETVIHAILPWPVVVHIHSVPVIASAVRKDGQSIFREKLEGLPWTWIPYCRPGIPLAAEIEQRIQPETQVLICANHGIFIGARTCEDAEKLLLEVEKRLSRTGRTLSKQHSRIDMSKDWILPSYPEIHSLALDDISLGLTRIGPLYPDHIVFLGFSGETPNAPYKIAPNQGVLVSSTARSGVNEMLLCWALVLSLLENGDPLSPLTLDNAAELLNWDAEKYRQNLNRKS